MGNWGREFLFAIAIVLLASSLAFAIDCAGSTPPCGGSKQCYGTNEICSQTTAGSCECVPALCPAPGQKTYLDATYTNDNNAPQGDLDASLYFIQPDANGIGMKKPVAGGLIIVDSGQYVQGSMNYEPFSTGPNANKVCKAFTDQNGNLNIKLEHPPGGMLISHNIIFCPYVDTSVEGQKDLAICARLADENGQVYGSVDYADIPDCDSSWGAQGSLQIMINGAQQNMWDALAPSETSVSASNSNPPQAQVTFCWALALVFGLLLSAS
ncbi:MAG: hypothetical protein V1822_04355, partial [Candidatus Micrarchaeota archaeon]